MKSFEIRVAGVRGFCSGVRRALALAEETVAAHPEGVWFLHEIVHNRGIVAGLAARGARFVESLEAVPAGATVVFSAHGVSRAVEDEARRRGLRIVDATCPLVKRIHAKTDAVERGDLVILIGHAGHPETVGTLGQHPGRILPVASPAGVAALPEAEGRRVVVLSQTTLSDAELHPVLEALRKRYGEIDGEGDLCYATRDRQQAVRELCRDCDTVLVIGSRNSSNSNRLCEVVRREGRRALLVDHPATLTAGMLEGAERVGVTAGASAPEEAVEALLRRLEELGGRRAG